MAQTAALVFFYFGESSYMKTLAQETVKVHLGLEDYDRQVLLRHDVKFGPFELSERAEQLADVIDLPTRENLAAHLNALRESKHVVDLFVFSHGSTGLFRTSTGTYGDNTTVTDKWLLHHVPEPLKLRAVWQCNCYGASMAPCWHELGAKVVAGSRDVNFYPTRWNKIARLWADGLRFGASVSKSDTAASHTGSQAYMLIDAASRLGEWDGNVFQATQVLGNNKHSRRYFEKCWLGPLPPEMDGKSGKQIMNWMSHMVITGNRKLRKTDTSLRW